MDPVPNPDEVSLDRDFTRVVDALDGFEVAGIASDSSKNRGDHYREGAINSTCTDYSSVFKESPEGEIA